MNWPESEEYKEYNPPRSPRRIPIYTPQDHQPSSSTTPHRPHIPKPRPQSPNVTIRNRNRTGGKTQSKRRSRQGSKTRKHKNKQRR